MFLLHTRFVLFFIFLLISISCIPFSYSSHVSEFQLETQVLLKLKQQWLTSPSVQTWNTSIPPCKNWSGVVCSNNSITGISLPDENISARIPTVICDLPNFTFLNLSFNSIPGGFPTVLYNCSKFQTLDLYSNNFHGPLPTDIYKLSNLDYLGIGENSFTGDIPPSIGQLTKLTYLQLYSNLFNGTFPNEIGNLINLETLSMGNNSLFVPRVIPMEFGKLKNLKHLYMWGCNLIGHIPPIFVNFSSLKELSLQKNNLVGDIPSGLFLLKNLTLLNLFENKLSGSIPSFLANLSSLVNLALSDNNLTGAMPEDIGNLKKLEFLALDNNQLSRSIPEYTSTRRLNEKIDVYSFGVVLLELCTGKEPRRVNEYMNLAEWSQRYYSEGQPVEDALDSRMKQEVRYLEEMKNVFRLGVMCTRVIPSARPSMRQVSELLISFNKNDTTSTEGGEESMTIEIS